MTLLARMKRWIGGTDDRQQGRVETEVSAASEAFERVNPPHPQLGLTDDVAAGWYDQEKGELFTGFPVGPDDVVADIGCGFGGNALFCAKRGANVILLDIDRERIAAALARINALPPRGIIETYVTGSERLPLADGAVSRVVCTEVIEHVDSPERLMAELARIGRPGALYLLSCPDPHSEAIQQRVAPASCFQRPNHIRILQHEDFARLVEGAGLKIEARHSFGFYRSMWLAFFWACNSTVDLGTIEGFQEPRHPILDNWSRTWQALLEQPDGLKVKKALDALAPKSQIIIARKP